MGEKEFNLLHEQWVRVMRADATVEELSLPQVLIHAHEYQSLAGEMPTQDIAILRLLLAVLHAVFTKVDENGQPFPLCKASDALTRWKALWRKGYIPEAPVVEYLQQYEDRFWLFHPERPFWQAKTAATPDYPYFKEGTDELVKATPSAASKLNGEILQSNNKLRLFANRNLETRDKLTYAEAARWIMQLNAYDDAGMKGRSHNRETFKDGWLGYLGGVYAKGRNLFETLMLNFVLLDNQRKLWVGSTPIWEVETPEERDLIAVAIPRDQAALMTLQSRRTFLKREDGLVTGYQVLAGEQFDKATAYGVEMMTMWERNAKENKILPRRHEPAKQFWREFSVLVGTQNNDAIPGVVEWQRWLELPRNYVVNYCAVGIKYSKATPHGSVDEVFSDTLSLHLSLLGELGRAVRERIQDEIKRCEKLALAVSWLAIQLRRAKGGKDGSQKKIHERQAGDAAAAEFYYRIDVPFRQWLITLNADIDELTLYEYQCEWQNKSCQIAMELGQEMVEAAGPVAFAGRVFWDSQRDKGELITAANAFGKFRREINRNTVRRDGGEK